MSCSCGYVYGARFEPTSTKASAVVAVVEPLRTVDLDAFCAYICVCARAILLCVCGFPLCKRSGVCALELQAVQCVSGTSIFFSFFSG